MKYIDAEKLKAEIEKRKTKAEAERVLYPKTILSAKNFLLINDYVELLSFIDSLQQEQPEIDEIKREWYNKGYLKGRKESNIPARELGLPKSCNMQEQPEVDLVAKLKNFIRSGDSGRSDLEIARHFYELGLNARKEE